MHVCRRYILLFDTNMYIHMHNIAVRKNRVFEKADSQLGFGWYKKLLENAPSSRNNGIYFAIFAKSTTYKKENS